MSDTKEDQDKLTGEETDKRRDEALKRALSTPPKSRGKHGEEEETAR